MKLKLIIFLILFFLVPTPSNAQESSKTKAFVSLKQVQSVTPKSIDKLLGNYNNQVKIVFSDIDGTLLPLNKKNPRQKPSLRLKTTVKELQKTKIPLILTTGRPFVEAKEIAKKMGCRESYIITQQGSDIRSYKGKLLYDDSIKNQNLLEIMQEYENYKNANNFTSKAVVFVNGKTYSTDKFKLPYNWAKIYIIKSYKGIGNASSVCIYEPNPERLKLIQKHLKEIFPAYNITISTDCYCEVTSPSASKGNAIKILTQKLGYKPQDVAVFGDAENDISMIKSVRESGGLSVVTGNAMEKLKIQSEYITTPVEQDGFSKAVEIIMKNNSYLKSATIKN